MTNEQIAVETIYIFASDGLMLPSGFVKSSSYACSFLCRVPSSWMSGDQLQEAYLEKILESVYGADWRLGNSDGSRYVVQVSRVEVLEAEIVTKTPWSQLQNNEKRHYWFFIGDENGSVKSVSPAAFEQDIAKESV